MLSSLSVETLQMTLKLDSRDQPMKSVNMAGTDKSSWMNKDSSNILLTTASHHEIKSDEDENDGSDDSILNISGSDEQPVLEKASSSNGKSTLGKTSTANTEDEDYLTQRKGMNDIPNLSKGRDKNLSFKDNQDQTANNSYINPDLFPVSSSPTRVGPSPTTLYPQQRTPTPSQLSPNAPTSYLKPNHQHPPRQPLPHQFDQLTFGDPTFINSFSPPFTPSPRRTPTLPLVGPAVNDLLLFSSADPQDLSSVLEGERNLAYQDSLTTPDVVPLKNDYNLIPTHRDPRQNMASDGRLGDKTVEDRNALVSLQDDTDEVLDSYQNSRLIVSADNHAVNESPAVLPGTANGYVSGVPYGYRNQNNTDPGRRNYKQESGDDNTTNNNTIQDPAGLKDKAGTTLDAPNHNGDFSTSSEFSNSSTRSFISNNVLSVGRQSHSLRAQSEPSYAIPRERANPRVRAMIPVTMFGNRLDEFGEQTTASLFPPDVAEGIDGTTADGCLSYRQHCHNRRMANTVDVVARRQLLAVVVLCLLFIAGEAVGGALSNSLALFTDVLHLGSDLISFIISLMALYLSNKPPSKTMSYGYHRAEVLGALFSVFLIWLVSGVLCYMAVERIIHEHYKDVKADEMLITASLGVVFNIIMGIVLHSEMCCKGAHSHTSFGHGHSHGHSHANGTPSSVEYQPLEDSRGPSSRRRRQKDEDMEYNDTDETQKILEDHRVPMGDIHEEEEEEVHRHKNLNVRAAFIHVLGDIIQSLGVLIAALIIKFQSDERYRLADPICTFIFSIIVLITTVSVLRDTIRVMMEGVPRDLSFESLKRELLAIEGVVMVHGLHIWALTLDRNALSVHLAIEDPSLHHKVLAKATHMVQHRHRIYSSTIQVEMYNREVMTSCHQCQELE